ncbi:MAG: hypothetical protein DMF87_25915 [Acidobacteria bacterium]|nr:MAG: hypothetical protein DMF88_23850 [Acidobacteriota bacterium]PYR73368.1 MAG: hypothetical protein DMF87_25915 [Acidobacteriota bacterium]
MSQFPRSVAASSPNSDPDAHAVGKKSARAFRSEVVPAEIDPPQRLAVPLVAWPAAPRLEAVRQQAKLGYRATLARDLAIAIEDDFGW